VFFPRIEFSHKSLWQLCDCCSRFNLDLFSLPLKSCCVYASATQQVVVSEHRVERSENEEEESNH
jgi:hypothetical protein